MSGKQHKLSRRQMLGAAATTAVSKPILAQIIATVWEGIFNQAFATGSAPGGPGQDTLCSMSGASTGKSLVSFFIGGGAIGWNFRDHIAFDPSWYDANGNPNPSKINFNRATNKTFVTKFDTNGLPQTELLPHTVAGRRLYLPSLFETTIPRPVGADVSMTETLRWMSHIRGASCGPGGHGDRQIKAEQPNPSYGSITGLIADYYRTQKMIPATVAGYGHPARSSFKSPLGVSPTLINNVASALAELLEPFDANSLGVTFTRRQELEGFFAVAMDRLADHFEVRRPAWANARIDYDNARRLLYEGVTCATTLWAPRVQKYRDLITAAKSLNAGGTRTEIPGVLTGMASIPTTARSLAGDASESNFYRSDAVTIPVYNSDLRTMITTETSIPEMAEGFALAEIMTVDLRSLNLTSALAIGIQPISGVNILDSNGNRVLDSAGRCQMAIDEHGMGARVSAILNAFYYRAIAASIYELTRQLDNVGEFGKTLITLGSEFGRSPQPSGSGSDHGNESVGVQMWSKMFPEAPQIAGYLRVNSATGYTGTWEGAPMPAGFGRPGLLSTSSIAASILTAMDVPSPFAEPSVLARAADGLFRFTIGADNV